IEQMKNDFVSLASHELRTPLTSIVGYVDLILNEDVGKISAEQREFLEIISQNTQRLEALINDVLDIEKIESGRIKLKLEKVNLTEIIEASVNTFKVMAEDKALKLEKEIKTAQIYVLGDANRLSQVFSNLLSNAIKYTKEGRVKVTLQTKERFASISVEDSGVGMSQEDQRRIFTRFFRAEDSYVRKTSGTGLGLSIAKATIERHNGDIKIKSKLGEGSKFEVILPLLKEPGKENNDKKDSFG
ncbi:GHKL domain-containing protein, partial [Candidatus Aerophobetes bacterium]